MARKKKGTFEDPASDIIKADVPNGEFDGPEKARPNEAADNWFELFKDRKKKKKNLGYEGHGGIDLCYKLIAWMEQGKSLDTFAQKVGVARSTLYEWMKKHEDFAEAYDIAQSACQNFWEDRGIEAMRWGSSVNGTVWKFNMQNRFGWTEKKAIEHTGDGGGPMRFTNLTEDEIDKRLENMKNVFDTLKKIGK